LKIKAYGVHVLTAAGAALGIWAIILTFNGHFHATLWVLLAAGLVDSVDGALARAVNTPKNAPGIDGALMDNIVDFVTWTVAPLFWIYVLIQIPVWVVAICAFASIFGFTNVRAKTDDNFFTGFPSFWNILAFYLVLLNFSTAVSSAILLCFAFVTFLPLKFIYPSKTESFRVLTLVLGAIFGLELIAMISLFHQTPRWLLYISFVFPAYYFATSFYLQLKHQRMQHVKQDKRFNSKSNRP
jgi:phosphatidylcholine synthase